MKTPIACMALFLASAAPLAAADAPAYNGPLFDTHMHYSRGAWAVFSPDEILAKMDRAQVGRALVSSTPDQGTAKLAELAPARIVAGYRPYRTRADMARWYENPDLLADARTRLAARRHKVFGEVILYLPGNLETPEMAAYLDIAVEQGLILQPHADAAVVEALFARRPELKILWAHAGFFEPAEVVGRMLDRYPTLSAELSYRADHIQPGHDLDPEWQALLIRHAGRFTIGSDTWTADRWQGYRNLIDETRAWLGKLPPDAAAKIAFGNAERLFGKGNAERLFGKGNAERLFGKTRP